MMPITAIMLSERYLEILMNLTTRFHFKLYIRISDNAFVFYAASCVFVSPKNLLALPPLGGKGLKDLRHLVFL